MRIAMLVPVFPDIHNTFVLNQITGLLDRGHEVDLYPLAVGDYHGAHEDVTTYRLRERVCHIRVPRNRVVRAARAMTELARPRAWHRSVLAALDPLGGRFGWSLVPFYTALSFRNRRKYDAVHVQFGHLGPMAARLVRTGGIDAPLVTSFRGADATSHLRRVPGEFVELFRVGSAFLPVSRHLEERIVEAGAPPARTFVHHSGIDLKRFALRERKGDSTYGVTHLLFAGRLVEKKGLRYGLEAVALALREMVPPQDLHLTIVGDGPLRGSLERLAIELGIGARVRFLGSKQQAGVIQAMDEADVLLAPSVTTSTGDMEGIPNVIKEAMAMGMPVLSTLHGGITELVQDGVSGYLVPEADVAALASRLRDLIDRRQDWPAMGHAGRAKVASEFDIERLNDALVERYRSAREAWRSAPR